MRITRQQPQGFKPWENLDITGDPIVTKVMRNKRLYRTLLEMILKVGVQSTAGLP